MSVLRFSAAALRKLATSLFVRAGVPAEEARLVADHLVEAGLTGHDTHGVLRLPQYVGMVRDGVVQPGVPTQLLEDHGRAVRMTGNWNFGPVTATAAMRLAVERTRSAAVTVVTVRDCNHVARMGRFAALAAEERMIGVVAANGHGGDLGVTPPGGAARRLPTNPLSIAVPTAGDWPVVLDMTTSAVSGGFLRLLRNLGRPAPEHTIVDAAGRPTTDVGKFYEEPPGALLPLGAPEEGHKGFGLGLMVDILAGALSGAGCSRPQAERGGNALFIAVLRVQAFIAWDEFRREVEDFIERLKTCPLAPGTAGVSLPGEHGYSILQERTEQGIPVDSAAWEQIGVLAGEYGVPLPQPLDT